MNNDNDNVMIGSPGASPQQRATFNTSPRRRYTQTNYNGVRALVRNYSRPSPSNLRRMRRMRMSFVNTGPVRRRLNFGNSANRPNTSNYMKNKNKMKNNANENNKTQKINWKKVSVKNLPTDVISTENFKSGEKAVKINKLYLTPNSFRKLARMSMTKAINSNGNMVLFKNPMTRGNVKKGDLEFVILKREVKK